MRLSLVAGGTLQIRGALVAISLIYSLLLPLSDILMLPQESDLSFPKFWLRYVIKVAVFAADGPLGFPVTID